MRTEVAIEALGAKGDGVARLGGEPVFVPFALPGERVVVESAGARSAPVEILERSPERQEPPCPHFGACGGCDLQHTGDALYRRFKRGLVVDAFASQGLEAPIAELVPCRPATRRRAVFAGARTGGGGFAFGFHERRSERIVPLHVCHVVVPAIAARLEALGRLASLIAPRRGEVRLTVTATDGGLDLAAADAGKLDERQRRNVLSFALAQDFARLTVNGETIVEARRPRVAVGTVAVEPPPGAFLQAVPSAEDAMAKLVLEHLAKSKQVADLFAGIGTFALRLAERSTVRAYESDAPALAALDKARRAAPKLRPVAFERRDLFRRPVTAKELASFDGAMFDPPRAGAEAQSREFAASKLPRIAAVSCNPATLARDCRILVDGGYRVLSVTPIDQFLWSHHVEAVALLER
ncbi:class I SAM-dependent RNA methyltransferase [Aureimonas leprariae]|uniref:Class I SAM-dependent RNA methyltransferase n=1 Tax=Plantimonas leprariae TaxID=2615207 RepID=A0A7V7PQB0_9HYPH|nr:class I SAM-dependent RNA methyltransferase [Aureimonas leprariae]KAB0680284.1 class I SAM-dependent RNA methyltransferase [Aureimonas leprariae]